MVGQESDHHDDRHDTESVSHLNEADHGVTGGNEIRLKGFAAGKSSSPSSELSITTESCFYDVINDQVQQVD
jgi:hypothetical protein